MKTAKLKSSTLGLMKMPHIKQAGNFTKKPSRKIRLSLGEKTYEVPEKLAGQLEKDLEPHLVKQANSTEKGVTFEEFFGEKLKKTPEWAMNLKGLRYREGLTQIEFAKKLKLTQSNLSAMENGRREIGKTLAKRIEKVFHVSYRLFL